MKTSFYLAVFAAAFFAQNAYALKITNLDSVTHTVVYDSSGKPEELTVAPDQSVHFHGRPDGFLSLKPAGEGVRRDSGNIHADGILSGIIGAVRSENIPASANYDFVIWPGGRLMIQTHRNGNVF